MNDDPYDRLRDRTWMQLRECTYVAMTVLKQISDTEGPPMDDRAAVQRAREALWQIEHVLSQDWEGPAAR